MRLIEQREAWGWGQPAIVLEAAEGDVSSRGFVQRYGSSLDLNNHAHVLMLDGAYVRNPDSARPSCVAVDPPPTTI